MHTHLGLPCLLGELPLLSSVISLIPRNFLCSKVHSVWCWYNHSCFLLISICMECFGVCWVSFLWKLRFSWFFACQLNLDFITDILNIMSGDSESHLKPVEYVDIFVSSGISPVGPTGFLQVVKPTQCYPDPSCMWSTLQLWAGAGSLSTVSSQGLWYGASGSDSDTCSRGVNPAFLTQRHGVASQAPPSPWPPQACPVPWGFTVL